VMKVKNRKGELVDVGKYSLAEFVSDHKIPELNCTLRKCHECTSTESGGTYRWTAHNDGTNIREGYWCRLCLAQEALSG
jgi:hypothetical protein